MAWTTSTGPVVTGALGWSCSFAPTRTAPTTSTPATTVQASSIPREGLCGIGLGIVVIGTDATTGATETRDGKGIGVAPERGVSRAAAFDPELERQSTPLSRVLPGFGRASNSGGCSIGR